MCANRAVTGVEGNRILGVGTPPGSFDKCMQRKKLHRVALRKLLKAKGRLWRTRVRPKDYGEIEQARGTTTLLYVRDYSLGGASSRVIAGEEFATYTAGPNSEIPRPRSASGRRAFPSRRAKIKRLPQADRALWSFAGSYTGASMREVSSRNRLVAEVGPLRIGEAAGGHCCAVGEIVRLKKSGQNFTGFMPVSWRRYFVCGASGGRRSIDCFGCGAGGDVFKFVARRLDRCELPEAIGTVAASVASRCPRRATVRWKSAGSRTSGRRWCSCTRRPLHSSGGSWKPGGRQGCAR